MYLVNNVLTLGKVWKTHEAEDSGDLGDASIYEGKQSINMAGFNR